MVRVLFFLGTAFSTLVVPFSAAPARYDQRQDGDFNLHAQLENFLFVVAVPSNNDLLSELALQALELKQQIVSRSSSKDHGSDSTSSAVYRPGEEPYSVEIVQIDDTRPDKETAARNPEGVNAETSDRQQPTATTVGDASNGQHEVAVSVARTAKSARDFERARSRQTPAILGYLVDARKVLGSKMEDGGRARNVLGNVWNADVEAGRSGASLKKQLFRRGEAEEAGENVAAPTSSVDRNDAAFAEEEQQELRLLGDGIENCGPGRRRDASGVCQFDESSASLL